MRGCERRPLSEALLLEWRPLTDFEQARLHELGSEQRELGVPIGLAVEPPNEPAVQIRRIGFCQQLVNGLTTSEVGVHNRESLHHHS